MSTRAPSEADQGSAAEGRHGEPFGEPSRDLSGAPVASGLSLASSKRGSLDLHEGIVDPPRETACGRWPKSLALRGEAITGKITWRRGRCKSPNLCDYCARLGAVETSEMLYLDACEHAPSYLVVLTAREFLTRAECRRHLEQLRRSIRKRWPGVEWAVLVEFQRRGALHLNLLLKGVPDGAEDALQDAVAGFWCSRVDAESWAQSVTSVYDGGGVIRYLAHHFNKPAQAPPKGWRGHRFSCTRGYLVRPASVMREEARRSLRQKRALRRGVPVELLELELELEDLTVWELWNVRGSDALIVPMRPVVRDGARAC